LPTAAAADGGSATGVRVQRHLVVGVHVDAFDDIDFAGGRPVGTDEPVGEPQTTDVAGYVGEIGHEEAAVVCWLADEFDAVASRSAAGVEHGVVVDADVEDAVARAEYLRGLRC